ncbi:serine protease snake-like [Pararge aegeria]|uniref:serine protease snake-like n=1 Tax=Pararge aegeria TaxID=116150 RepID=UPI0019CF893B|nr:serine protease snake-like [Pararge aegeria]
MWYDLYLLVSILTSFLESTSFSTRIINQNIGVSNGDRRELESSMEIEDLLPPFDDRKFGMTDFSDLTTIDSGRRNRQFESVSEKKCVEYVSEMLKRQEQSKLGLSDPNVTIINGKVVKEAEYPHMGALGWWTNSVPRKIVFLCGGSLISDRFMLTAAHCTYCVRKYIEQPVPYLVRLGSRYLESLTHEAPEDVRIRNVIKHPRYKSPRRYYDIALIQLDKIVRFTKFLQPACLSTSQYSASSNNKFTATGWGSVQATSDKIHLIDIDKCNYLLKKLHIRLWNGVAAHQLCAGELNGNTDTCKGDSGGPIQQKLISSPSQGTIHRILAVTSFGPTKCTTKHVPGVYSNVSYFAKWIERIVWPEEYDTFKYKKYVQ